MPSIDDYIQAATRDTTRKAYRAAVEHYEDQWGGFLPATSDNIARYLAAYGGTCSVNTLRLRLAALATWHKEQGFVDPTKSPLVKKVLRGITELHPRQEKQANPIQLTQLETVIRWVEEQEAVMGLLPTRREERVYRLRLARDKALLLLGFWRAFRSDELVRMRIENCVLQPGQGMSIFFPRSKSDRHYRGSTFKVPALQRLCPVTAFSAWLDVSGLEYGPVFRKIDRWGQFDNKALHRDSIVTIIRRCLSSAGIDEAHSYSSHSLRRGFATWAAAEQWNVKLLMEYVGWKDTKSAMRYIDTVTLDVRQRIESGLAEQALPDTPTMALPDTDELISIRQKNSKKVQP